nr:hypothetical protein Iba_chr09bCG11800 [Ipomoea batatas]
MLLDHLHFLHKTLRVACQDECDVENEDEEGDGRQEIGGEYEASSEGEQTYKEVKRKIDHDYVSVCSLIRELQRGMDLGFSTLGNKIVKFSVFVIYNMSRIEVYTSSTLDIEMEVMGNIPLVYHPIRSNIREENSNVAVTTIAIEENTIPTVDTVAIEEIQLLL